MTIDIPTEWTFESDSVAEGFDAHVREQLPWYDLVTRAIVQIGRHYIPEMGTVYDIGASNGNIGRALAPILEQRGAMLWGVEPSPEMRAHYDAPGGLIDKPAEAVEFMPYDFAVAMLALMFVAPAKVPDLLDRLIAQIEPGGALVVVERTLPPPGYLSIVTSRITLASKAAMGATGDEIVAKELSLAGIQRPLDSRLLTSRGAVEWFRFGDFAGYIIEAAA